MSLASPARPASPPPPVFAVTSAFFESPFSANNHHNNNHNTPSIPTGFKLQKLIADDQQGHQSMNPSPTAATPIEWTPLSSRPLITTRQQTPVQAEDRLDRLLAEMEAAVASPQPNPLIVPLQNHPSASSPIECWELNSLETRFQPVHTSTLPTRPCLKNRSTSVSSLVSSDQEEQDQQEQEQEQEEEDTLSASASDSADSLSEIDSPLDLLLHPPPSQEEDHRTATVRVRFDDHTVEEFLTWSRESYDRKGPLPITKLNLRELIELKLIKEELGISPVSAPVAIEPSLSTASSSSASVDGSL